MFIFIDVYMFICKCDGGTCLEMAVNGVVFGTMHMRRCGEIKCWGVVVMMLVMRCVLNILFGLMTNLIIKKIINHLFV